MNTPNAFAFIAAGLMMEALRLLPSIAGTRALWLLAMGGVLTLIGGAFIAQTAWAYVSLRIVQPQWASFQQARIQARENALSAGKRVRI